jgi:hypothetical protein
MTALCQQVFGRAHARPVRVKARGARSQNPGVQGSAEPQAMSGSLYQLSQTDEGGFLTD